MLGWEHRCYEGGLGRTWPEFTFSLRFANHKRRKFPKHAWAREKVSHVSPYWPSPWARIKRYFFHFFFQCSTARDERGLGGIETLHKIDIHMNYASAIYAGWSCTVASSTIPIYEASNITEKSDRSFSNCSGRSGNIATLVVLIWKRGGIQSAIVQSVWDGKEWMGR